MRRPHLLTFEDPIEVTYFRGSTTSQKAGLDYTPRQKGKDINSLKEAVRDALRQTPTVFFVGETRDNTDWKDLLQFVETGHLAFTTTPAGSLIETISKILQATNANTAAARSHLAQNILAVTYLKRAKAEESNNINSLIPALWRNTPSNVKRLISNGLSSLFDLEIAESYGRRVYLLDVFPQILDILRKDYSYIYQLNPDQFELLICDRLSKMGFEVERVGSIYSPDGGVDIVAWPKNPTPFPYLLATQVKHHKKPSKKTGPGVVKELQAVVASQPFQAGLLVTNTCFTPNAQWFAAHQSHIIRLRDMYDLKRWIHNNFTDEAEWREIPHEIELSPGIRIKLRRS
jgi:hypothetical protein